MRGRKLVLTALTAVFLGTFAAGTALGAEKGWTTVDGVQRFLDANGNAVKNEWRTRDGGSYYLDDRGEIARETWIGDTYYVGRDGRMVKDGWIEEDGTGGREAGWYFADRNGKIEKNDWKSVGEKRYAFDAEGRLRTGWHFEDGDIYYLDAEERGAMAVGWRFLEYNGKELPEEGTISKKIPENSENGSWFYFRPNGKAKRAESSSYVQDELDGKHYYFDENGAMATGWIGVRRAEPGDAVGVSRFVYASGKNEGVLRARWLETDIHPGGSKDKGLLKDKSGEYRGPKKGEKRWYYLSGNGTPVFLESDAATIGKAAVKVSGSYYFFDSYGCMQTGLIRLESGGEAHTGYFGREKEDGGMRTGLVRDVTDKRGNEYTFYFSSAGSTKGEGYTGERDGFLYNQGRLVAAKSGEGYQAFEVLGKLWLVNESGRVMTEDKVYRSGGKNLYRMEDGVLYDTNDKGEKGKQTVKGETLPKILYDRVYAL